MGGESSERQLKRMAIGGFAGTAAKTVVAPLERVRILAQTGHGKGSILKTTVSVVQNEGITGLWRGNLVNCARVFPSRGILFSCNDLYKTALAKFAARDDVFDRNGKAIYPFWLSFSAGATAGMTACAATYPLDVARTRMTGRILVDGGKGAERSLVQTLVSMAKIEGLTSWYRGVGPTLLGALPYEGIKFAVYDWTVDMQLKHFDIDPSKNMIAKLGSGAFAGAVAGLVMFPNDTIRRLLQMQGSGGAPIRYRSAWHCWVTVIHEEGVRRLFRGVFPYLIRMVPNSAIQFGVYGVLSDRFT